MFLLPEVVINPQQRIFDVLPVHNLLRTIAVAVGDSLLGNTTPVSHTIYMPNRRSCCEFRRYLYQYLESKAVVATLLPTIKSISDEFSCDDVQILLRIVQRLRSNFKNKGMPISSLFALAQKLYEFVQTLLLEDIDHHRLFHMIPDHLMENLMHTLYMLQDCMEDAKISSMINVMKAKLQSIIHADNFHPTRSKIITIGIEKTHRLIKIFLNRVASSSDGLIFNIGEISSLNAQQQGDRIDDIRSRIPKKNHIEFCEFNNLSEESFGVAIAVRKAIAENKSVMVVSPHRSLAEKIKYELLRWNIIIDDSTGTPMAKTSMGICVTQLLNVIDRGFSTPATMALLKIVLMGNISAASSANSHELFSTPEVSYLPQLESSKLYKPLLMEMEIFFRSSSAIPSNFFGAFTLWRKLRAQGASNDSPANEDRMQTLVDLIQQLQIIAAEISVQISEQKYFVEWYFLCRSIGDLLLQQPKPRSVDSIFCEFTDTLEYFLQYSELLGSMTFAEFSIFVKNHLRTTNVRTPDGYTPGVVMLGITEAQLLDADLIIVAGVNDANFSFTEPNDFWITKSMLKILGIQTADEKNRFVQRVFERLIHKDNVLITRSKTADGIQRPCYRFFERLMNNLKIHRATWLEQLMVNCNRAQRRIKISSVAPNPPICYRPLQLSISDVELLMHNPYGLYAKKILGLRELRPMGSHGNVRGNFIHEVLDKFIKSNNIRQNVDLLHQIAEHMLDGTCLDATSLGLWYFRLKSIFAFVMDNLPKHHCRSMSEVFGEYIVEVSEKCQLKISGILDRIDIYDDGSWAIVDYKSGVVPSRRQVMYGHEPQLAIEALMAQYNGNGIGVPCTKVSSLQYWRLNGLGIGGEIHVVAANPEEVNHLMDVTLGNLRKIITKYNIIGIPYEVNVQYLYDAAYRHLARIKEWSNAHGT
ncbi:MAG: PD-(D/E)XK nuclease family protein [Holosporaceae bacterium]|nr:PD-(D/E)XK nuclease family protein [Holosporaceae bacterium]